MLESERNTFPLHRLLTNTDGHLSDVNEGAFGTSNGHLLDVVVLLDVLLGILTRLGREPHSAVLIRDSRKSREWSCQVSASFRSR